VIANAPPTPKAVALVLLPALVLMLMFAFFYVGAFHEPTPHHVPVAVIGQPAVAAQLNRVPGDPLDARPASSRPDALSQIDNHRPAVRGGVSVEATRAPAEVTPARSSAARASVSTTRQRASWIPR
jgi:hypothetical protein